MKTRTLALGLALAFAGTGLAQEVETARKDAPAPAEKLWYTTYFYTATEAVVHGYEDGTQARIISMEKGGTIWEGTVDKGDTKLIPTGQGAFGFVSDKKASILVGTPSSCTAVGYWVRDEQGGQVGKSFFTQLPSSNSGYDSRVIVWAWEDTEVTVFDRDSEKTLFQGTIEGGYYHELTPEVLASLGSHTLAIDAEAPNIAVQVYYDEGFFVPARSGRGAGTEFRTYVGHTTNGENDLVLFSYNGTATVTVEDVTGGKEPIWSGTIEPGHVHTLTLTDRYVKVTSDIEISAAVTPYEHYKMGGYAEHHFSLGAEGTGIENDFMLTTPGEIWVFSYFDENPITVVDVASGEPLWTGTLNAGQVYSDRNAGHGLYRIKSSKGMSVMGGSSACGAEYSPAGGLFTIDETLFKVVQEIRERRKKKAESEGRKLSEEELNAPLADEEIDFANSALKSSTGRSSNYSSSEINERVEKMEVE